MVPERVGVVLGTTLHGIRAAGRYFRDGDLNHFQQFLAPSILEQATADLDAQGISVTTCSACSSGLGSIALAMTLLNTGELDCVIAGGYDPISEYAYGGFNSLRLVATGPARPFCSDREGLKLGEGYGVVVLERSPDAAQRKANVLGRLCGYGETADAHHLTQPHPEGDGAARALQLALADAELEPGDIDLICAHATSTPDNDGGEFKALSRVFEDRLAETPVVSFKSHVGHTLGGAGAVELILGMMALRDGVIPPTANVTPQDVEYVGLNLTSGVERSAALKHTMHLSLGFGGANTCLVLAPAHAAPAVITERRDAIHEIWITGVGAVAPGRVTADQWQMRGGLAVKADTGETSEDLILPYLNARRVRRMSAYVTLSLAATALAMRDAGVEGDEAFAREAYAVLGTAHGSACYSADYYKQIVEEGLAAANPMLFAEGVPNAGAAHLSLMLGLKGSCQSVLGTRTAGLEALRLVATRMVEGRWSRALVSVGEEYAPLVRDAYAHCGLYAGGQTSGRAFEDGPGFAMGDGAVTFVLERADVARARGMVPRAVFESWSGGSAGPDRDRRWMQLARRTVEAIKPMPAWLVSANGTWIDRIESHALQAVPQALIGAAYGHLAETFSVSPLAGLASWLLHGRLPELRGTAPAEHIAACGDENPDRLGVLGVDYTGAVAVLGLRTGPRQGHSTI